MSFAVLCSSHAPLALRSPADRDHPFCATLAAVGKWVAQFDPEIVIQFAPDHFNGFFYDAMPNFCIASAAESVGDWATRPGQLPVPAELALRAVDSVRAADVDVDLSCDMKVDHGFTQIWEMILGRFDLCPMLPVMINCAAAPRPPFRRVRLLGEAIGRFAAGLGQRVLFSGSGGLSHDPPVPTLDRAEATIRAFLLGGRNPSPQSRAAREARVVAAADDFVKGCSAALPPDPDWDRNFLDLLAGGDLTRVDSWTEDEVTEKAGCGGHEVRTWIAAYAAMQAAAGPYVSRVEHYSVVPQWMTGMGVALAVPASSAALLGPLMSESAGLDRDGVGQ